jgi:hypothetical protein
MSNDDFENSDRPCLSQSKSLISRHRVIIVLLFAALLIRLVFFAEIIKGPCYKQHLWDMSDMNFFHSWAMEVVNGDWLLNKPLHPYHDWHDSVANTYFSSHEKQGQTLHGDQPPAYVDPVAKRQIWNRWYGEKRYHQEPLYPYMIALVYKLFSARVGWVFLLQLSLGIANILLIYTITMRFFDRRVAAIAGSLAVLCAPLLFFEMVLLRETLISFFGLFLVWLVVRAQEEESSLSWVKLGLFLGLAVLLKSIFLLFLVGLTGSLIIRHRHSVKHALTYAAALFAGLALSLTPLLVRNIAVGTSPLGLSSVTAVTFLSANASDADPHGFQVSKHVAPIMGRTDGAVLPTIIETLKTQSFTSYAKLAWRKFGLIWHWYEIPNNTNFYYYRLHSLVLRFLPVSFLILAPLCLVGVGLAIYERRRCFPLYLLLSTHVVTILLVYVSARFRAPLLAALLPFAALTLTRIIDGLQKRIIGKTLLICVLLILVSFWTMSPLPKEKSLIRAADAWAPYTFYYRPLLSAAQAEGDLAEVLSLLESLLRSEPQRIHQLSFMSPPQNLEDRETALMFSQFRRMYATGLLRAGRNEEEQIVTQRAKELEILSRM